MKASNPDKVMFPGSGYTKADLVAYYTAVADTMLPLIEGRPLTMHRFPNGIGAKGFMQKNVAKHFPDSIERLEIPKQEGGTTVYPVIREADDIPWLANQGTITFHVWLSRLPDIDQPDWMVLDLDPSHDRNNPRQGADVHTVAAATRSVLDEFALQSYPVATGSKGFHLWIPLEPAHEPHAVIVANRALAGLVAARNPNIATTEFLKKDRKGRVFVDWLRANRGATVVAPLSLRAKAGAPAAAPVTWDELPEVAPDQWTIRDIDRILDRPTLEQQVTRRHRLPVDDIVAAAGEANVDLDTPFDRFGRKPG